MFEPGWLFAQCWCVHCMCGSSFFRPCRSVISSRLIMLSVLEAKNGTQITVDTDCPLKAFSISSFLAGPLLWLQMGFSLFPPWRCSPFLAVCFLRLWRQALCGPEIARMVPPVICVLCEMHKYTVHLGIEPGSWQMGLWHSRPLFSLLVLVIKVDVLKFLRILLIGIGFSPLT